MKDNPKEKDVMLNTRASGNTRVLPRGSKATRTQYPAKLAPSLRTDLTEDFVDLLLRLIKEVDLPLRVLFLDLSVFLPS